MFIPVPMLEGKEIPDVKEDFRTSAKIEQYRIGKEALYLPEGLRWKYLPYRAIRQADESFRVISAGHCVPVREKRPEIDLVIETGTVHLSLEKPESLRKLLDAINAATSPETVN